MRASLSRPARRSVALGLAASVLSSALAAGAGELSGTRVDIIDTWPAGNHVSLGSNQSFYLRLAYSTDTPVRIWARPYLEGEPADAGSHPSRQHSGDGEALGWFFLSRPGSRVDEIRITAGDGTDDGTPLMAVWRGQILGSSKPGVQGTVPAWVEELKRVDRTAREQALQAQMNQPLTAWEKLLFTLFIPTVLVIGAIGLVWPFRALMRWRGSWRLGAALPATVMGFVVLRLIIDVALDPRSHNLWPFEILLAGAFSGVIMLGLALARKLTR